MAPNSIGAFLFNTVRENINPEPCLSTSSRFSTWRPNVVVANTATHKQVNFLTPPKAVSKKRRHSKLTQKGHVVDSIQLYMATNSTGAFLFNTVRENRNPEPCLSTYSRFSTWRPTGDSIMNQRTSYPKTMSINFKLIRT